MEEKNSATFNITTKGGYSVFVTLRESDLNKAKEMFNMVGLIDSFLVDGGIKPQEKKSFGGFAKKEREWVEGICPKDGGRLYHMVTKAGKDMCKCENSKYDFTTKVSSGCDFVAWGKNLKDAEEQKAKWLAEKAKVDNFNSEYGNA